MPDIILPRRLPGLTTRRRSVEAPTAADVPTVNPAVARDPGLDVPRGAFGGGIDKVLETLSRSVPDIAKALGIQQRLQDATGKEQSRADLVQTLRDGLDARTGDQDFTEDPVRLDYLGFVNDAVEKSKQRIRQAEGAARISDTAMAALDPELDDIGDTFRLAGDTLHLRGVEQRGVDQLTLAADEAAKRARRFVAAAPGDGARFTLRAELALFDDLADGFRGAFRDDRDRDLRARGISRIIEAGLTGLAEQGRGADARMLLEHADFADDLDADTRSRLSHDTAVLSDAFDKDQALQATRQAAAETRAKEAASLAFARDFRTRLAAGEASHGEIAAAETAGALSPGRANRLRAELADDQARRQDRDTRAGRITALLDNGERPDPGNPDDRADVAHHFEATLRPALADMDPAQKAAAIGGYARDTGMVPDAALDTLMGLSVTGKATDRIAAAGQLSDMLARYPEIRRRVPPALIDFADLIGALTDADAIPPDDIIGVGDGLMRDHTSGAGADQPSPGLVQLASFESAGSAPAAGEQTDGLAADVAPADDTDKDTEDGEDGVDTDEDGDTSQNGRPDGRLQPGLDAAAASADLRENNTDRITDEITDPARQRRSGRFRETLGKAEISAEDRNDVIDRRHASEDTFSDDDELPPSFADNELLTEEELKQFELPPIDFIDGPHNDPHKSQFGNLSFSEMSTQDLKRRLDESTAGLQNQAIKLDKLNQETMAAQDKEEPTRKEIKELEKELKEKVGVTTAASLIELVEKRVLSVPTVIEIISILGGEAKIRGLEKELDPLVRETRNARKEEDAQKNTVLIWLTEQRNIEAELKRRENETHR